MVACTFGRPIGISGCADLTIIAAFIELAEPQRPGGNGSDHVRGGAGRRRLDDRVGFRRVRATRDPVGCAVRMLRHRVLTRRPSIHGDRRLAGRSDRYRDGRCRRLGVHGAAASTGEPEPRPWVVVARRSPHRLRGLRRRRRLPERDTTPPTRSTEAPSSASRAPPTGSTTCRTRSRPMGRSSCSPGRMIGPDGERASRSLRGGRRRDRTPPAEPTWHLGGSALRQVPGLLVTCGRPTDRFAAFDPSLDRRCSQRGLHRPGGRLGLSGSPSGGIGPRAPTFPERPVDRVRYGEGGEPMMCSSCTPTARG